MSTSAFAPSLQLVPVSSASLAALLPSSTLTRVCLALLFVVIAVILQRRQCARAANPFALPVPPGPPALPLIGNLLDIPTKDETATYSAWARKYGDLFHLNVLGRPMIFASSLKVANDLFEKRSANYSDRTRLVMINELMDWSWCFAFLGYGERWRQSRKCLHSQFQPSVAATFRPTHTRVAHNVMRRILDDPRDLVGSLRHYSAATIMAVTYGIEIADRDDSFVGVAEDAMRSMSIASAPGAFLVDILPFLKHVPEWFPGAGFQRKAREWKALSHSMRDKPFEAVKFALAEGYAKPSFVTNLLEKLAADPHGSADTKDGAPALTVEEQEDIIKGCAGTAYAAGTDSIVASIHTFCLAMLLHPAVQRKAQAELDTVLARDGEMRLPEFADRGRLPYIDAIVKEVLRWAPVAPLGLPHMVTKDDTYNGYFIPSGSIIVGFTWELMHDESVYFDSHKFDPERFIATKDRMPAPDPAIAVYGVGRRICPGRHMADAAIWIAMATFLSVFDITPAVDLVTGKPEEVKAKFTSGMICHPVPFNCTIRPRSAAAERLLRQTADYSH